MRKDYATKTIIIYIFIAMQKYTTRENPVSYTELARYSQGIGKPCDRKTVARNVDYLIKDGFPIMKTSEGSAFIANK